MRSSSAGGSTAGDSNAGGSTASGSTAGTAPMNDGGSPQTGPGGSTSTACNAASAGAPSYDPQDDPCLSAANYVFSCNRDCAVPRLQQCNAWTCASPERSLHGIFANAQVRTPSHPGCACSCADTAFAFAIGMYDDSGLVTSGTLPWKIQVGAPWKLRVSDALPADGGAAGTDLCAHDGATDGTSCVVVDINVDPAKAKTLYVYTTDPDAPARNVWWEGAALFPTPCN